MLLSNEHGFHLDIHDLKQLTALHVEGDRNEHCAVMLGRTKPRNGDLDIEVIAIVEVPNTSEQPEDYFQINSRDLKAAITHMPLAALDGELPPVIGFVHTHSRNEADPSYADITGAKESALNFVLHHRSRTLTMFDGTGYITKFTYSMKEGS